MQEIAVITKAKAGKVLLTGTRPTYRDIRASMSKGTVMGLDLVKWVFQVHGVDAEGHAVLKKRLRRAQRAEFFARLEPCLVAMEACGSAHHGARQQAAVGHTPRLIPPPYVKPLVKTNQHEAAEAAAIATAARQPVLSS